MAPCQFARVSVHFQDIIDIESHSLCSPVNTCYFSILYDNRQDKSKPSSLNFDLHRRVISYNGAKWTDLGIFIGDTGGSGGTGDQGKAFIINEVVEFPDGSMTFRKHFKRDNGSADGWYAIL